MSAFPSESTRQPQKFRLCNLGHHELPVEFHLCSSFWLIFTKSRNIFSEDDYRKNYAITSYIKTYLQFRSRSENFTYAEKTALDRLIVEAKVPTREGQQVADFLLAWWNSDTYEGFNPTKAWSCDDEVVEDLITIFLISFATSVDFPIISDTVRISKA